MTGNVEISVRGFFTSDELLRRLRSVEICLDEVIAAATSRQVKADRTWSIAAHSLMDKKAAILEELELTQ